MKMPNSVFRHAVPAGMFGEQGGKAMELYGALWKETRGAVVPRRKARMPKDRLMQLSGIGSEVTLRKNLSKLRASGLVVETVIAGTRGGNEYEVFQPEEIGARRGDRGSTPSSDSFPRQHREGLEAPDATGSSPGANAAAASVSDSGNTFSLRPSSNDDDEAFASLLRVMKGEVGRRLDSAPLAELAEMLAAEFKLAAGRTGVVSNPSAFFLEHMRRRLWKKDKRQLDGEENAAAEVPQPKVKVDASKCPDCFGTGMWYPEGFDKGVVRCRHEKLGAVD